MAIQFPCPSCNQPIEVDDEYAGQTAACPYCQRVVGVPTKSILAPRPAATARPASPPSEAAPQAQPQGPAAPADDRPGLSPPPPPGSLHVGALPPRQRAALTYGNYALICTVLSVGLFAATATYLLVTVFPRFAADPTSQPAPEQLRAMQEEIVFSHPVIPAGFLGATFFAVVGLALGIVSVRQSARGNWRGILSLVVCAFFVLCFCGGNLLNAVGVAPV